MTGINQRHCLGEAFKERVVFFQGEEHVAFSAQAYVFDYQSYAVLLRHL